MRVTIERTLVPSCSRREVKPVGAALPGGGGSSNCAGSEARTRSIPNPTIRNVQSDRMDRPWSSLPDPHNTLLVRTISPAAPPCPRWESNRPAGSVGGMGAISGGRLDQLLNPPRHCHSRDRSEPARLMTPKTHTRSPTRSGSLQLLGMNGAVPTDQDRGKSTLR